MKKFSFQFFSIAFKLFFNTFHFDRRILFILMFIITENSRQLITELGESFIFKHFINGLNREDNELIYEDLIGMQPLLL